MGATSRSAAAFVLTDARGAQQPEAAQPEPPGLARGRRMRGVVIAIGVASMAIFIGIVGWVGGVVAGLMGQPQGQLIWYPNDSNG